MAWNGYALLVCKLVVVHVDKKVHKCQNCAKIKKHLIKISDVTHYC